MNMDALSGTLILADWNGRLRFVTLGFSVGVELGAANAAFGIATALYGATTTVPGVWIDASCWDGAVQTQCMPIGAFIGCEEPSGPKNPVRSTTCTRRATGAGALLRHRVDVLGELLPRVDRNDLIGRWGGTEVDFGEADQLRSELEAVFRDEVRQ